MRKLLFLFSFGVLFCGCVTIPQYKEAKSSEEHAVIKFQSTLFKDSSLTVREINGKAPSSTKWICTQFNVYPGPLTVLVEALRVKFGYVASDIIKINAEAGHVYYFSRDVHADTVTFKVTEDDAKLIYSNTVAMDALQDGDKY